MEVHIVKGEYGAVVMGVYLHEATAMAVWKNYNKAEGRVEDSRRKYFYESWVINEDKPIITADNEVKPTGIYQVVAMIQNKKHLELWDELTMRIAEIARGKKYEEIVIAMSSNNY